ncbi:hypothetical protein [Pedosphaera parvula]|uniref:Type II secretion system protein GspG C-terminal domain-containing protein n=1 Tax=Pedosphaera parvula (strain Ellin514) TaxID=320771 RepID=B9XKE4_PEDPL|nr:hypothetical protein [Pedosphaera parvula]EEF59614.1 hypothetical protein Cflav_PD2603 [Pedosphaera parvula Ellin514]
MTDHQPTSIEKRGFLRCLFSWRMIRRYLFCLACLATLVALFYAVENWRGKHAWEQYKRELTARGINMDWHQFIPPPVPDEQNFAMTPFLAALYDFNPEPLQPGQSRWKDTNAYNRATQFGTDLDHEYVKWSEAKRTSLQDAPSDSKANSKTSAGLNSTANAKEASEILKYLEKYGPVLEEVRLASRRPYSRFNLRYDEENPAAILLPHLGVLNHTSQVLKMRAEAELASGKTDAAAEDVNLLLHLSDSIENEPTVISVLVRNIITKNALQVVWEGLAAHQWSDNQLKSFQDGLEKQSLIKHFDRTLHAEAAAFGNQLFEYMRNHGSELPVTLDQNSPKAIGVLYKWSPKGWFYQEQLSYLRTFNEKILPFITPESKRVNPQALNNSSKYVADLGANPFSTLWHHRIFTVLLIPTVDMLSAKIAKGQTDVDLAVLAGALERYRLARGELPDSLELLVPQFIGNIPRETVNGEPFKYQRTNDRQFELYSVGWNEKDDGGKTINSKDGKSIDPTQGDWVWPQYPSQ